MEDEFQRDWRGGREPVQFLLDARDPGGARRHLIAGAGALLWHVLVVLALLNMPAGRPPASYSLEAALRAATPLVAPRLDDDFKLTQKAPQLHSPATEVNAESLQSRPEVHTPARRPLPGGAPPGLIAPSPAAMTRPIETPQIEVPQQNNLAALGNPALLGHSDLQPPPAPARTPFEPVAGQARGTGSKSGEQLRAELRRNTVEDAARAVIRSGAAGRGLSVGDADAGGGGSSNPLSQQGLVSPRKSSLELLSDPQGVDFKPYLIQVLMAVRKSWFAVLPESARYGRSGRVTLQFAVNRDGQVPKLVIAMPSGAEALDRAAVAGISGAVPLPPLPASYKGAQIRLQLVFSYNMPQ